MRKRLSSVVEAQIKREFNHLCAICGKPSPQIHHIDQDATNNAPDNLLPLCPNHHLLDAHSPTQPVDPGRLKLFRVYKDPTILFSQFEPLYRRLRFLLDETSSSFDLQVVSRQADELIDFVSYLQMGGFYRDRLKALIKWDPGPNTYIFLNSDDDQERAREWKKVSDAYSEKLHGNSRTAVDLVVELLRFQDWKRVPPYADA